MFFQAKPQPAATIHERFECQVAQHPRSIAVECDGVRLTYRELNQEANRMARRLVAARVGTEAIVLVAMERSCELIVTMLAVLKAGGAFSLLDNTLAPEQRSTFIRTSGAEVAVTDTIRTPMPRRMRVVRYYAASGEDRNLEIRTQTDRWACVVADKARSHAAVLEILDVAAGEFQFQAGDGMFSAMDLAGHAAVDLLLPLIAGGRLVLASAQEMAGGVRLESAIEAANCKFVRLPKALPGGVGALSNAAFA